MNKKRYGRKWPWHNLKHYPGICLKKQENHEKLVMIASLQAEI
jgi:hypothetical protein